jgi:hypothetical protein
MRTPDEASAMIGLPLILVPIISNRAAALQGRPGKAGSYARSDT